LGKQSSSRTKALSPVKEGGDADRWSDSDSATSPDCNKLDENNKPPLRRRSSASGSSQQQFLQHGLHGTHGTHSHGAHALAPGDKNYFKRQTNFNYSDIYIQAMASDSINEIHPQMITGFMQVNISIN
jgi:hypothetical protein